MIVFRLSSWRYRNYSEAHSPNWQCDSRNDCHLTCFVHLSFDCPRIARISLSLSTFSELVFKLHFGLTLTILSLDTVELTAREQNRSTLAPNSTSRVSIDFCFSKLNTVFVEAKFSKTEIPATDRLVSGCLAVASLYSKTSLFLYGHRKWTSMWSNDKGTHSSRAEWSSSQPSSQILIGNSGTLRMKAQIFTNLQIPPMAHLYHRVIAARSRPPNWIQVQVVQVWEILYTFLLYY